jgi:hypothetical protein
MSKHRLSVIYTLRNVALLCGLKLLGQSGRRFTHNLNGGFINVVLKQGVALLDEEVQAEVRSWLIARQTRAGGFPDRAGACDLYYTLFGFFLAEALELDEVMPALKNYVKNIPHPESAEGIDLFCLAILYSSLFPEDPETGKFIRKIKKIKEDNGSFNDGYSRFLVMLTLLYARDLWGAWKALKAMGEVNKKKKDDHGEKEPGKPCPVVAAEEILACIKSGFKSRDASQIMAFYRGNGGFAALTHAPAPDLLSTAVALFALRFSGCDLTLIRPECMEFVENLYDNGGFRAVSQDADADVEYTFYGILALGALNESSRFKLLYN